MKGQIAMKYMKVKAAAAALFMAVLFPAGAISAGALAYTKGDANGSGSIDVTDISLTAAHIRGIRPLTEKGIAAADVNGDGSTDVTDISLTAAHIKGIKAINDPDRELIEKIGRMTLHQKICQMCIIRPEGQLGDDHIMYAGEDTRRMLGEYPVGGVVFFGENMDSVWQTENLIDDFNGYNTEISDIPLFISVDEEGGSVARCANKLGTTSFYPMYEYRWQGTDGAYSNAKTIAQDISGIGFDLDFAPVADTWSNPYNTVIGRRAYSDDFGETAELVASAVKGFHDGGVACTLKHFPGHGDTAEDSHLGTAISYRTLEELDGNEYRAFRSGIAAGADMVMVGHINMANVDNMPASLSETMINGELRGKLGYDGVVITDALEMKAVSDKYTSDEAAVRVVEAGGDILLMPEDLSAAVSGLENAVKSGEISEDRIDESVMRILRVKRNRGLI